MHSPFVHIWVWLKPRGLDIAFGNLMPKKIKNYVDFVAECVEERLKQEESVEKKGGEATRKDMLHYLFQAKDPETGQRGYTREDLLEEADMLTVAATDTTAAAMAAAFFYLSRNKTAYEKLKSEIRNTFTDVTEIGLGPRLNGCKYLDAVINETLRMSSPGSNEFPREVLAGGIRIGDQYLPPGTNVGCCLYALFHDQNIFGDPWVFRPERWIAGEGGSAEGLDAAEKTLAPFLFGVRGCPGKNLALMELHVVLARLLHGYEFRLAPNDQTGEGNVGLGWGRQCKAQYQTRDAFVPMRNGPFIQFASRA